MATEIEQKPAAVVAEEQETPEEQLVDTTDWKAEALKARRIAARRANQLTKLQEAKVEPAKQESKSEPAKPEEFGLLQKSWLRSAGITDPEEVELAKDIQKRTGIDWEKLPDDDYFKSKLESHRAAKANLLATSGKDGGSGSPQTKFTPEFYIARGSPPTREEVPDRAIRSKIIRAMMSASKSSKTFYND